MGETVIIALIAGSSGFLGALAGAAGAVFGPWWLRRDDRRAEAKAALREARRGAIVEWTSAEIALANSLDEPKEVVLPISIRTNAAITVLLSHLQPGEGGVAEWFSGGRSTLVQSRDGDRRRIFASVMSEWLLEWHRGDRGISDLKPFVLRPLPVGGYDDPTAERWDPRLVVS